MALFADITGPTAAQRSANAERERRRYRESKAGGVGLTGRQSERAAVAAAVVAEIERLTAEAARLNIWLERSGPWES